MTRECRYALGFILMGYDEYVSNSKNTIKPDLIFIKRFDELNPKEYFELQVGLTKKGDLAPIGKAVNKVIYTTENYDEHKYFKKFNYNEEYLLFDYYYEILTDIERILDDTM